MRRQWFMGRDADDKIRIRDAVRIEFWRAGGPMGKTALAGRSM
jgi:hypothetical protein